MLVPPMSTETACASSNLRARRAVAATPAAGPDITVASGSSRARPTVIIPPPECTTNDAEPGNDPATASSCPRR